MGCERDAFTRMCNFWGSNPLLFAHRGAPLDLQAKYRPYRVCLTGWVVDFKKIRCVNSQIVFIPSKWVFMCVKTNLQGRGN